MNRQRTRYFVVIVSTMLLALFGNAFCAFAAENDTIAKGVFIDDVDIGGMTGKEAEEAVDKFVDELRSKEILVQDGEKVVSTTLGDMGYSYKINDAIDQALQLGTAGNLIKRYKDLKDISQGGINYPLEFTLDENKVREWVSASLAKFNVEPVNATVARNNGEMVYTDHILGKKADIEANVLSIVDVIENSWDRSNIVLDAYMEDVLPIYTREIVEQCNTVLGTFSTEYTDSAQGRAANLANGAKLINNTVLFPGEVFSGYEHLAPFDKSNGYYVAGAYSKGKVIDSVGGGACQVTTTLYNAVLKAELEIVQRQEHSMTISYVGLSRDAAIAGTFKDLKFMNNTDSPILIEAFTKGRKITFKVWGHEVRDVDNRTIEFETRVLSETAPPPEVIEEDPTKPITYRKVTQSAHTGYRTELYKVVYENGVEVGRTLINKSYYAPAPRYVIVGTMEEVEVPVDIEVDENGYIFDDEELETDKNDKKDKKDKKDPKKPDEQLEDDIFWDPDWDEEGLEDE